MADKLKFDAINAIPQPFYARFCGGDVWPVYDIEVETGLMRIDVCGLLQTKHFSDVTEMHDEYGTTYNPDDFYVENEPGAEIKRCPHV